MSVLVKKPSKDQKINAIAWAGAVAVAVAVLTGYTLFSTAILPNPFTYHVLTMLSSAAVGYISYRRKVWQATVINTVLAVFAGTAIIRAIIH